MSDEEGLVVKVAWTCMRTENRMSCRVDPSQLPEGERQYVNRYICDPEDVQRAGPHLEARTAGVAFSAWLDCHTRGLKSYNCERYK